MGVFTMTKLKREFNLEDADELSKTRKLGNSFWGNVIKVASITLSLFHLYTAGFGSLPLIQQRSFHLAFVLFILFLLFPITKKSSRKKMNIIDPILALTALLANFYVFYRYDLIAANSGILTTLDLIVGGILIVLVIEAIRRASGEALPYMMIGCLIYAYFGRYFPGFLQHYGLSVRRIIQYMVWSTEGIYGITLGVSATFLFLFILFGAVLEKTGLAAIINDLALAIAGRSRGGPAKVAIVASAALGTISGSAVANVATTGVFTIPMMKKMGYAPPFAATVEAVASTGGMIMPPIMGAAAFIMAEFLGVPYVKIMTAAIIPALLYYFSIWVVVDLEAQRLNLKGICKADMPNVWKIMKEKGYMLLPIAVLIYFLMTGSTTLRAAFYSIISAIVLSYLRADTRMTPKRFLETLENAGQVAIPVASICAVSGIMIGVFGATGLGLVLGDGLLTMAGGNYYATVILIAIASLFLGLGLPSTACYIIVSTLAAPALIKFGIDGIPAHLFAFYFGVLSVISPPIATASFTAAGIAGSDPNLTGWMAFKYAIPAFLIPFIFISSPEMLLINTNIWQVAIILGTALIGVYALAAATTGYLFGNLKMPVRIILGVGGAFMMTTSLFGNLTGIALTMLGAFLAYRNRDRSRVKEAVTAD